MFYLHVVAAILAMLRLTELFLVDRITEPLRRKFKTYLWGCSRCMSVWTSVVATLFLIFCPWLNWPFALAFIYLAHNEAIIARRRASRREFVVHVDNEGNATIKTNDLTEPQLTNLGAMLLKQGQPTNAAVV